MTSLDWIKQIDEIAVKLEKKPQFGKPFNFSWEDFTGKLQAALEAPLTLTPKIKGWTEESHLFDNLGKDLKIVSLEWAPLKASTFFATTEQDIKKLMSLLLGGDETASFFYEPHHTEAFMEYFIAEVLHVLDKTHFSEPLSPRLGRAHAGREDVSVEEPCFVADVGLSLQGGHFWGRILVPKSFREEWSKFFAQMPASALTDEMREKIPLEVSLEVGKTRLNRAEWKNASVGDFLILDRCSYNPDTNKGGVLLTLQGKPVFRARYKEGTLKITHYPEYEEESMERNMDEDEESNLYGDKEMDENFLNEFPEEENETEIEGESGTVSFNPDEIPLELTVEISRLKMSAKELVDLAPGNVLDLQVSPEQGVDLVINGKKVGRGELVRLGEVLGVRILAL